jgi:hypothetical protein
VVVWHDLRYELPIVFYVPRFRFKYTTHKARVDFIFGGFPVESIRFGAFSKSKVTTGDSHFKVVVMIGSPLAK